jgi:hypothetical protein
MNSKFAVAILVLPLGLFSLIAKPAVAAENGYYQGSQPSGVVTQQPDRDNNTPHNYNSPKPVQQRQSWHRSMRPVQNAQTNDRQVQQQQLEHDRQQHQQLERQRQQLEHDRQSQNRPNEHRVWIAGHYEPGFLEIRRKWVEGHWEVRR